MTYWLINGAFLVAASIVAAAAIALVRGGRRRGVPLAALGATLAALLVMTAIFDNIMIEVGLVGYDRAKISGQFVGIAPLEDFAYAVASVILLPALWVLLGRRRMPRPERSSP